MPKEPEKESSAAQAQTAKRKAKGITHFARIVRLLG
jgi:hypothetical protein